MSAPSPERTTRGKTMKKPRVITSCVASHYAAPNQRIIEFSSEAGGGLISFVVRDGKLVIDIYRTDSTVVVKGVASKPAFLPGAIEALERLLGSATCDTVMEILES